MLVDCPDCNATGKKTIIIEAHDVIETEQGIELRRNDRQVEVSCATCKGIKIVDIKAVA